jgi:hypothetical protein
MTQALTRPVYVSPTAFGLQINSKSGHQKNGTMLVGYGFAARSTSVIFNDGPGSVVVTWSGNSDGVTLQPQEITSVAVTGGSCEVTIDGNNTANLWIDYR